VLPTGRIVVPGTTFLAGSGLFTDTCIGHVLATTDVSLADAVDMASARPRRLLGLEPRPLQVGAAADLVLFDWLSCSDSPLTRSGGEGRPGGGFHVRATVIAGDLADRLE